MLTPIVPKGGVKILIETDRERHIDVIRMEQLICTVERWCVKARLTHCSHNGILRASCLHIRGMQCPVSIGLG